MATFNTNTNEKRLNVLAGMNKERFLKDKKKEYAVPKVVYQGMKPTNEDLVGVILASNN